MVSAAGCRTIAGAEIPFNDTTTGTLRSLSKQRAWSVVSPGSSATRTPSLISTTDASATVQAGVTVAEGESVFDLSTGKLKLTEDDFPDWYIESYRNYSRDSCMILIGYNDQDNRIASLAKKVNEENIPIILLTGPYKNEIDQYAHLILRTSYAEEKSIPGSLGSLTAMDYLISVLFTAIMR